MAESLRRLRRATTQLAVRLAIKATAALPIGPQRSAIRTTIALAGHVPMLRNRVRENMRLALGDDVPAGAEREYFRLVGWSLSSSLAAYHHGLAATPIPNEVRFDESIRVFDEAIAEGRGVVLTAPHWSGHELAAGVISRRHPIVMLVRQGASPERMARKLHWYRALGTEIVLRPSNTSMIKDAVAYLKVLKHGKVLAITPDLLAGPGDGMEVNLFGRRAVLRGGAFALAMLAQAPMIRISGAWRRDLSVLAKFERAPPIPDTGDRDAAVRHALQDWCNWFEEKLRAAPENWLFWLDKRWTHFLHSTPRIAGMK